MKHEERTDGKVLALGAQASRGLRIWGELKGWVAAWQARRETLRLLRECRDGELKDIGLTGADVERAALGDDLSGAVAEARRKRSGNW